MVSAFACITLRHIVIVFFSLWMLLVDWAPTKLAAIVWLLVLWKGLCFCCFQPRALKRALFLLLSGPALWKGLCFAAFSPVLWNKGSAQFLIVAGLIEFYIAPVKLHLCYAKKSRVVRFIIPYCGCRSLACLQGGICYAVEFSMSSKKREGFFPKLGYGEGLLLGLVWQQ
jgi:hypothetical protein